MKIEITRNGRTSIASVCEHGGHWCRRCQRYVETEDSQRGYWRCLICHGTSIRFDPPLEGYHAKPLPDGK